MSIISIIYIKRCAIARFFLQKLLTFLNNLMGRVQRFKIVFCRSSFIFHILFNYKARDNTNKKSQFIM